MSRPFGNLLPLPCKTLCWLTVCLAIHQAGVIAHAQSVTVGIDGHYRVGRWTGVRYQVDRAVASVETRDGDGVQVEYEQSQPNSPRGWGYVVPGSEAAPLILHGQQDVIHSTRFATTGSPSRGPAMIPPKMPWIVVIGDPLGVDQIGANKLLGRDPLVAVSLPEQAEEFPDSVLGYDGIDMMMLGGSSASRLSSLSPPQQQAIAQWITGGGRVFLTLGRSAPDLIKSAPWLGDLLPFDDLAMTRIDPSALETYTSSQTPLQPFEGVKLPKQRGQLLILGRTTRRVSTPMAVAYNVGFGRITVVAADLDNDMFAAWPERLDLITRLTGDLLVLEQEEAERKTRATAYNDLAGQLRVTLDQFAIKRAISFSFVSLILLALLAAIGPLDHLLINRLLGRPLLGWISFPLFTIGLALLLVFQSRPVTRGGSLEGQPESRDVNAVQCNRVEIFDLDSVNQVGLGFTASYLYSHDAARFDLDVTPSESLSLISDGVAGSRIAPFGTPGESFGGIQIAIEDARLPVYQVTLSGGQAGQTEPMQSSLKGLPLASRSSKGIATRWRFSPNFAAEVSVTHRPGSELLQGELVNPLPLDVLDGMLVYRNWAYLLPTRFPAGGRIPSLDKLRQKNFRWQLSRQKALESATETEDWDPAASESPERILEMLMFHDAVGGTRYTGLRDDALSFLDLSHVLSRDRCILIGKLARPLTETHIRGDNANGETSSDAFTVVRVVIPVETP